MGEDADDGANETSAQAIEELRRFGVAEEQIEKLRPRAAKSKARIVIEIEPENRDAVQLFAHMQTQWRVSPVVAGKHLLQLRTGLDYAALEPVKNSLRITPDDYTLAALREMERQTLKLDRARHEEQLRKG